jgi:hypothetical protein
VTSSRTIATVTGVLFLITFITSIPAAFVLYPPVLNDPTYILGAGADMGVKLGALLEVILVVANIGTAVVLYPLLKRQNSIVAVGYVAARVVKSTIIAVGILSLLSVVTLDRTSRGLPVPMLLRSSPLGVPWSRSTMRHFCWGLDFLPPSGMGSCWAT